jgi:hypothetical protein
VSWLPRMPMIVFREASRAEGPKGQTSKTEVCATLATERYQQELGGRREPLGLDARHRMYAPRWRIADMPKNGTSAPPAHGVWRLT